MPVRFEVQSVGSGPPLLIQAPGWGPTSDYLRLTLAPMIEAYRVITYDPRNVGAGPVVDDADAQAVEHLVADLEEVRAALALDKFILAGHSHGAFVAMAYAVRHQQHLQGLVLLNPRLRHDGIAEDAESVLRAFETEPARRAAVELFRATAGRLRGATSDAELARQMRRLMPAYFFDLAAMRRFALQARAARGPSLRALQRLPELPESWVEEGLPGVEVPALVLTGRADVATTPGDAHHIAGLLHGCTVEIFERSGHHPWVEEPERFSAVLNAFLDTLDTDPRGEPT